jgi:hypothetical protein
LFFDNGTEPVARRALGETRGTLGRFAARLVEGAEDDTCDAEDDTGDSASGNPASNASCSATNAMYV